MMKFLARLSRNGILYCIDVPPKVSKTVGKRGNVPVVGTVNGVAPFRATLVPRGGGLHRMYLVGEVRRAAGVALGDRLRIELEVDPDPFVEPVPEDLAYALDEQGVRAAWDKLPFGKRNHIIKWIDEAVAETTREKRVARAVEEALAKHEKLIDRERRA